MADNNINMTEAYIGKTLIYALPGHEHHKLTIKGKYSSGMAALFYNEKYQYINGEFKSNQMNTFYLPALTTKIDVLGIDNVEVYDYPSTALVTSFMRFSNNITYIDDSVEFDTSSVTTMYEAFAEAPETLKPYIKNVEKWNTGKVKSFGYMFAGAYVPDDFDLSSWDVSKSDSFMYMFGTKNKGYKLNLSGWKFKKNANYGSCLNNCMASEVNINGWDFKNCGDDIQFGFVGTTIGGFFNLTGEIKNIEVSVKCHQGYITHSTVMLLANALLETDTTKYFTLPERTDTPLSENEIAIITSKGYTIGTY